MTEQGVRHIGPLLLVLAPLVAAAWLTLAALVPALRLSERGRHALVLANTLLTFLGVVALVPAVLAHGFVEASVPALLGELRFRLDGVGALLALLAGFVWCCSTLHAGAYFAAEEPSKARRYHLTSLVTLAGMLTVLMAADLVTLYVGFEWLGLVAYLFVVHSGTKAAEAAGLKYLALTLLGGFAVLAGVLLVHALGGGDLATPVAVASGQQGLRTAAAICLLLGFGVKAGALGLHSWLPDAHAAAPAPASALLSAVMIKAGAYGIVRTLGNLYRVEGEQLLAAVGQAETLGLIVLWWGVATMLVGVVMALWQHQAKRLLAYSSVSQMGFILAGVGAATYLGPDGAIGWTGSLFHVVNHGLFKALLFLAMGAVIAATGTGDLRRLGGLARRMPWTFALTAVGVAGIAGLPLLNGFVSKSVIHHALEYAMAHAREGGHAHGLAVAERLFTLTTVGTAAALIKLLSLTFLGSWRGDATTRSGGRTEGATWPSREAPRAMLAALAALALAVVTLGLRPGSVAPLLVGALEAWRLPSGEVVRWLNEPITHAGDLRAAALALLLGALVHLGCARTGLYARRFPAWLSLDWLVLALLRSASGGGLALQRVAERVSATLRARLLAWGRALGGADRAASERYGSLAARLGAGLRTGSQVPAGAAQEPRVDSARTRWQQALLAPLHGLCGAIARRLPERGGALRGVARRRARSLWRGLERRSHWLARRLDASWRLARETGQLDEVERERLMLAARARIQRQSRDVGLGMALLVLIWLVVLASFALRVTS